MSLYSRWRTPRAGGDAGVYIPMYLRYGPPMASLFKLFFRIYFSCRMSCWLSYRWVACPVVWSTCWPRVVGRDPRFWVRRIICWTPLGSHSSGRGSSGQLQLPRESLIDPDFTIAVYCSFLQFSLFRPDSLFFAFYLYLMASPMQDGVQRNR